MITTGQSTKPEPSQVSVLASPVNHDARWLTKNDRTRGSLCAMLVWLTTVNVSQPSAQAHPASVTTAAVSARPVGAPVRKRAASHPS